MSSNKYKKFEDDDKEAEKPRAKSENKDDTTPEDTVISVHYQKLEEEATAQNVPAKQTDDDVFPVLVIPPENSTHVNVDFVHLSGDSNATSGNISQSTADTPQNAAKIEELKSTDVSTIPKGTRQRHPPMAHPPPDYLSCSIFVTVLCCPILGAFAIHQSMQSRRAASRGHRARAIWASQTAWKVARVAFLVGILVQIVVVFALVEALA